MVLLSDYKVYECINLKQITITFLVEFLFGQKINAL